MSGVGNFLVGAVQGFGAAGASLSSKYIDDEILRNRQQAFLDMQRASNLQQAKDMDEFQNDPTRRENLRVEAGKDAAAANSVALEGKIAEATNTRLTDARRANLRAEAAIPGEVAAEQVKTNAADPAYLKSVRAVALADPRVQAQIDQARASIAQAGAHTKLLGIQGQAAELELNDRKKLDALFDRYDHVLNDKSMDDKTRGVELGKLTEQLNVMRAKTGRGATGAQESDTVKITEEQSLPGGGTRKTERTEKRKPGTTPAGDKADPFGILAALQAGKEKQTESPGTRSPEAAAPVFNPTSREDNVLQASIAPKVDAYRAADKAYRQVLQSSPSDQQALAAALEKRRDAYLQVEDFARSMFARDPKNPTLPEQKRLSEFFKSLN